MVHRRPVLARRSCSSRSGSLQDEPRITRITPIRSVRRPADEARPQHEPQRCREGFVLVVSPRRPSALRAVVSGTARVVRGKWAHYRSSVRLVSITQCWWGPTPRQLSRGDSAPRSGRRRFPDVCFGATWHSQHASLAGGFSPVSPPPRRRPPFSAPGSVRRSFPSASRRLAARSGRGHAFWNRRQPWDTPPSNCAASKARWI